MAERGMLLSRRRWLALLSAFTGATVGGGLTGCGQPLTGPRSAKGRMGAAELLRREMQGFEAAQAPRTLRFPQDHMPHRSFATEWWYLTGQLRSDDDELYGFQFTLFRQGLVPPLPLAAGAPSLATSAWRASEAWMAHVALTQVASKSHQAFARLARGALGLAGTEGNLDAEESAGLRLFVEDVELDISPQGDRWQIRAQDAAAGFSLGLSSVGASGSKPLLHGQGGLSRKGPESASYYYSIPRMSVSGKLGLGERSFPVAGMAWLDREWSTSELSPAQVGWDWLSLSFADGTDLMLFRLRRQDGRRDPFDAGTLRLATGEVRHLSDKDFVMTPTRHWWDAGSAWPVQWRIEIDAMSEPWNGFMVNALVDDQRMRLGIDYWEGVVEATHDRQRLGLGYLEMTGY